MRHISNLIKKGDKKSPWRRQEGGRAVLSRIAVTSCQQFFDFFFSTSLDSTAGLFFPPNPSFLQSY